MAAPQVNPKLTIKFNRDLFILWDISHIALLERILFLTKQQKYHMERDCLLPMSPKFYATKNFYEVNRQIKSGVNVNIQYESGMTALNVASANGNVKIVKLLLDNGADPNLPSLYCGSSLIAACPHHYEVVELLINSGANVNINMDYLDGKKRESALHEAVASCNMKLAKLLIDHGSNLEYQSAQILMMGQKGASGTPLHYATFFKCEDIIKLLISKGANVNAKNYDGITPVIYATITKQNDIVKELILNNADANIKMLHGFTALHFAASYNYTKIVRTLLDNGADINAKIDDGTSALSIATKKKNNEAMKILKQYGAK